MKRWTYLNPKIHMGPALNPRSVTLPEEPGEAMQMLIRRIYVLENQLAASTPEELLPCSACGSAAELVSTGAYAVTCTRCDRATDFFPSDPAAAVHAWNVYFR